MPSSQWTILTNHGALLLLLARQPNLTIRAMAGVLALSDRAVVNVLRDLRRDGYVEATKRGRSNAYRVRLDRPMRRPAHAHLSVGEALERLAVNLLGESPK